MEPFNYDLFSSENISAFIAGIGILLASIGIGSIGFMTLGRKDFLTWLLLVTCIGAGGLIGWGIGKDIVESKNNDARLDNLITQAEDIYGVELDRETAEKLNPPFSTPSDAYAEFGQATIPFMGSELPVRLVWNEGVLFFGVEGSGGSLPTLEDIENQGTPVPEGIDPDAPPVEPSVEE